MATCVGLLVKVVLLLVNLAWLAIGSFVLYLGLHIQFTTDDSIKELFDNKLAYVVIALCVLGGTLILISTIGFFGACCESSAWLKLYGTILMVLLVVTIVGVCFGFKYQEELSSIVNSKVKQRIDKFEDGGKLAYSLQKFQTWMQCCGWNGPNDYNLTDAKYPSSCCNVQSYSLKIPNTTCSASSLEFKNGCKDLPIIESFAVYVIFFAIFLILIQLVVILVTFCFAREVGYQVDPQA